MRRSVLLPILFAAASFAPGCAFSSKSKDWNELSGLDKKPTYYINTTKIGFNLAIFIPFIGDMGVSGMVRDMTQEVKREGGDQVRITQGGSENYWYGWPPFTWALTPVISTVAAEYEPSPEEYAADQMEIREVREQGGNKRWYKPWSW